jgi:DNA-binding transcriptional LysR family regulator
MMWPLLPPRPTSHGEQRGVHVLAWNILDQRVAGLAKSQYRARISEVAAGEATIDIVAKGFDAGIGPRDRVPADMIAVRVMAPMKVAIVAAPAYFARRRPPRTPDDLARHSCIQYRRVADGDVLKWAFKRDRKSRQPSVDGRLMVNSSFLAVRAAVDGLGIAYIIEALAEPFPRSGQLVRVLEDWSPSFEGLFLYYPGHRQVPALIDMIRSTRGSASGARRIADDAHGRSDGLLGRFHDGRDVILDHILLVQKPNSRCDLAKKRV